MIAPSGRTVLAQDELVTRISVPVAHSAAYAACADPLTLTGLTIEPKVFPAGPAAARFALSRPALVVLRIDRVLVGKLRRGRCTVTGAARKTGPRCVRYDPTARTTALAGAGANRIGLDTKSLGPGRYRLRVSAVDGSEQTPQLSVRFRMT